MADKFIPVSTAIPARLKVRCVAAIAGSDPDIAVDDPILQKYSLELRTVGDPQDANGVNCGPRQGLPSQFVPMKDALQRSFTAGGITATGAQVMALFNEVVDFYKVPQ